jgi:hypothetical protein
VTTSMGPAAPYTPSIRGRLGGAGPDKKEIMRGIMQACTMQESGTGSTMR